MRFLLTLILAFLSVTLLAEDCHLESLPKADEEGLVLSSQVLSIEGARFPYNGALVKKKAGDGYWLFFRENFMGLSAESFGGARIGVASLSKDFLQIGNTLFPPYPIFGKSVEDPRAFWIQDSLYLLYYIYPRPNPATPCLLQIDPDTLAPLRIQMLSHEKNPEKNWVPLVPKTDSSILPCIRNLFPYDLVEVDFKNKTHHFSSRALEIPREAPVSWEWGPLSGGTQGELIGDTYLSFFHSWFLGENEKRIYVMGACTFSKEPPFYMKEISPYPILFQELYTSNICPSVGNPYGTKWASGLEKVIFPCGFVEETRADGKDVLHVSCGENDNAIRIITFDKDALLNSLIPVHNEEEEL